LTLACRIGAGIDRTHPDYCLAARFFAAQRLRCAAAIRARPSALSFPPRRFASLTIPVPVRRLRTCLSRSISASIWAINSGMGIGVQSMTRSLDDATRRGVGVTRPCASLRPLTPRYVQNPVSEFSDSRVVWRQIGTRLHSYKGRTENFNEGGGHLCHAQI